MTVGVDPLGATIDDAAGEAFDKVARLLGLPFPGGPHIDRAAASGNSVAIDFPRGLTARKDLERHRFDFSFSGLKTAVARWVEAQQRAGDAIDVADVAASFQEAVCDVLTRKAIDAAATHGIEDILHRRRRRREQPAAGDGRPSGPRRAASGCGCRGPGLCTDNGAMVAALGAELVTERSSAVGARPPSRLVPAHHHRGGLRAVLRQSSTPGAAVSSPSQSCS